MITTTSNFVNLQEFEEFITDTFINGSAINPDLLSACVEFHQDVEISAGMDASTPIHDELGWDYKRFRHEANKPIYAAFLKNEDGSVWQVIVSIPNGNKPYSYYAPKNAGDKAFLPPVPTSIREKINKNLNLDIAIA
jgi:putative DNA primase/helicase